MAGRRFPLLAERSSLPRMAFPTVQGRLHAAALLTSLVLPACVSEEPLAPPTRAAPAAERPVPGRPLDLTLGAGDEEGSCEGEAVSLGGQRFLRLDDSTLLTLAPLAVRFEGAPRAFHPRGAEAGAIQHLCNAGEVFLPDGTSYEGASSSSACERFSGDAERIAAAGWDDPSVGAVRWHGVAAEGSARIAGARVPRVRPLEAADGSGFYVSQTGLRDEGLGVADHARYLDATAVPYAALRRDQGVALGSHGVAIRVRGCRTGRSCAPVPFVVGDHAVRAGAGSAALARRVNGLPLDPAPGRRDRFQGQVGDADVLTVFFGGEGEAGPLDAESLRARSRAAFDAWGGEERLVRCRRAYVPRADG